MSKSILSSELLTFIILHNHTHNSQNFNQYFSWVKKHSVHSDPRTFKTTDKQNKVVNDARLILFYIFIIINARSEHRTTNQNEAKQNIRI
jgi:hypothetical protein